ncbi:MAG: hypothetical protein ACTH8Q_01880, partial [Pseudomonas taetrolens]
PKLRKNSKLCPGLVDHYNRTRSGKTNIWNHAIHGRPHVNGLAEVRLEPPEAGLYAERIDDAWYWVSGCAKCNGTGEKWSYSASTHGVDEALSTISAGGTHHALVQPVTAPFLTECANGSSQRNFDVQEPLRTQVAQVKGGHFAMVAANMVTLRKGSVGAAVAGPLGVVATSTGHHAVSAAFFEQTNGGFYKGDGRSAFDPISTICQSGSNQRLVNAYLVKYYGNEKDGISLTEPMHTLPTKDRVALVEVVQMPDIIKLYQRLAA